MIKNKFKLEKIAGYIPAQKTILEPGEFYVWFPVTGKSMTNRDHPNSIPDKSKVLCREIKPLHLKHSDAFYPYKDFFSFPVRRPVIIWGEHNGEEFKVCKEINFVDMAWTFTILCHYYNTKFHEFNIPIADIRRLFVVEEILRPNRKRSVKVNIQSSPDPFFH